MCLAIPMKIVEAIGTARAVVELDGVKREIGLALGGEVAVGDYVIVSSGFAIDRMKEAEANELLSLFRELAEQASDARE